MQNNLMEIRTDALKLLSMLKRPVPRSAVSIGAWLNIFQVLYKQMLSVYAQYSAFAIVFLTWLHVSIEILVFNSDVNLHQFCTFSVVI